MQGWAFWLLKRDAAVCLTWPLVISLLYGFSHWDSMLGLAVSNLLYISSIRLVHYGYIALIAGGDVRPSRASRLAVIILVMYGFVTLLDWLRDGPHEGSQVVYELLWLLLPPLVVITAWDVVRERPSPAQNQ